MFSMNSRSPRPPFVRSSNDVGVGYERPVSRNLGDNVEETAFELKFNRTREMDRYVRIFIEGQSIQRFDERLQLALP